MLDHLKKYNIILASNSPRRKQLLSDLGVDYIVRTLPDVDESYPDNLLAEAIPAHISRVKAEAYRRLIQSDELIITADTIVWLEGALLGKPSDREGAYEMLRRLSGKTHEVFTGVTLTTCSWQRTFTAATRVTFAPLTEADIIYYVDAYQPLDKAGSYGIQEWIGLIGVERIEGSYFNVMGLPIQRLYQELSKL